jgi:hypothetical protein
MADREHFNAIMSHVITLIGVAFAANQWEAYPADAANRRVP